MPFRIGINQSCSSNGLTGYYEKQFFLLVM